MWSNVVGAGADFCALAGTAIRMGAELVPWTLRPDSGLRGKGAVCSCWRHLGGNGEKHSEPGSQHLFVSPLQCCAQILCGQGDSGSGLEASPMPGLAHVLQERMLTPCALLPGWKPAQWGVHGAAVPSGPAVLPAAVWPDLLRGTCSFAACFPCTRSTSTPCCPSRFLFDLPSRCNFQVPHIGLIFTTKTVISEYPVTHIFCQLAQD